jgi:uncharacterized protein (DUF697 family)
MRLFGRKSKWDHVRDAASEILTNAETRRLTKVMLGVVGGAVAATAASAAVSSIRHQDET